MARIAARASRFLGPDERSRVGNQGERPTAEQRPGRDPLTDERGAGHRTDHPPTSELRAVGAGHSLAHGVRGAFDRPGIVAEVVGERSQGRLHEAAHRAA
jgi:hypothetical protein